MIRAEAAANQMVPGPRCQSTAAALIEGRLRVDEESKAAVCTTRTEAIGFRVASDHTRREAVPAMGGMGRPRHGSQPSCSLTHSNRDGRRYLRERSESDARPSVSSSLRERKSPSSRPEQAFVSPA